MGSSFLFYIDVCTTEKLKDLEIDNPGPDVIGSLVFSSDYGIFIIRAEDQKNISISAPIPFFFLENWGGVLMLFFGL